MQPDMLTLASDHLVHHEQQQEQCQQQCQYSQCIMASQWSPVHMRGHHQSKSQVSSRGTAPTSCHNWGTAPVHGQHSIAVQVFGFYFSGIFPEFS